MASEIGVGIGQGLARAGAGFSDALARVAQMRRQRDRMKYRRDQDLQERQRYHEKIARDDTWRRIQAEQMPGVSVGERPEGGFTGALRSLGTIGDEPVYYGEPEPETPTFSAYGLEGFPATEEGRQAARSHGEAVYPYRFDEGGEQVSAEEERGMSPAQARMFMERHFTKGGGEYSKPTLPPEREQRFIDMLVRGDSAVGDSLAAAAGSTPDSAGTSLKDRYLSGRDEEDEGPGLLDRALGWVGLGGKETAAADTTSPPTTAPGARSPGARQDLQDAEMYRQKAREIASMAGGVDTAIARLEALGDLSEHEQRVLDALRQMR